MTLWSQAVQCPGADVDCAVPSTVEIWNNSNTLESHPAPLRAPPVLTPLTPTMHFHCSSNVFPFFPPPYSTSSASMLSARSTLSKGPTRRSLDALEKSICKMHQCECKCKKLLRFAYVGIDALWYIY